ncbi:MAG: CoA pyrophosphatase [Ornithinimicrobium sp.]
MNEGESAHPQQHPPPAWMLQLADAVQDLPAAWAGRFVPSPDSEARQSAVLMLFAPGSGGTEVVLTQRAATLRAHAGQVSFPGGGHEEGDVSATATALREAREEVGLRESEVSVLAALPPLHIPVSRYDVTPILGWWHSPGRIWARQRAEVQRVVRVPLDTLLDPATRFRVRHPSGYTGPGFAAGSLTVWGFTAGLLDSIFEVAGLTRPWDRSVVREVS